MFIFIIIGLLLYGSYHIMPRAWEMMPGLIADGDHLMIVCLGSCIVAAILAILIAIFKYFDSLSYAIETFIIVCFIAAGINSYLIMKETSLDLLRAVISSLIVQFQFALPIGLITFFICVYISYRKNS